MGWNYGVNSDGREVGYSVTATCDEEGCDEKIDHGLAYVCGGMHDGGDEGCGGYFCYSHLFLGRPDQLCQACQTRAIERRQETVSELDEENPYLGMLASLETLLRWVSDSYGYAGQEIAEAFAAAADHVALAQKDLRTIEWDDGT
jgi:hypothetical protein